jgi:hypothetical protein
VRKHGVTEKASWGFAPIPLFVVLHFISANGQQAASPLAKLYSSFFRIITLPQRTGKHMAAKLRKLIDYEKAAYIIVWAV